LGETTKVYADADTLLIFVLIPGKGDVIREGDNLSVTDSEYVSVAEYCSKAANQVPCS